MHHGRAPLVACRWQDRTQVMRNNVRTLGEGIEIETLAENTKRMTVAALR
jgi:hypothetical protein